MSSDARRAPGEAVRTERLSKRYLVGERGNASMTLREQLTRLATVPAGRLLGRRPTRDGPDVLDALCDVSLTIGQGEVVGFVGSNGAGKSTLLKVLSRITEPTSGWGRIHGRVGSLLEVGTGFHPELTGRENIYLNGAILGMRRAEIRRQFDEIVAFAEIERFLDTPVKRYSSGMYVRLAFAVAAHLQTEVLIVDEVLAVGDAAFQRKSLGRMGAVAQEGRTVLFVSHNMAVLQALCTRGVVLEAGRVVMDGPVADAVGHYLRGLEQAGEVDLLHRTDRDGWHDIMVAALQVSGPEGAAVATGGPARFAVTLTGLQRRTTCALTIVDNLGQPVCRLESGNVGGGDVAHPVGAAADPAVFVCDVPELPLLPGRYRLDVEVRGTHHTQDRVTSALYFDVESGILAGRPVSMTAAGVVAVGHRWTVPVLAAGEVGEDDARSRV
ncbi:ABC transporter ATP-binding protein [Blastococcus sp. SYSU D00695]